MTYFLYSTGRYDHCYNTFSDIFIIYIAFRKKSGRKSYKEKTVFCIYPRSFRILKFCSNLFWSPWFPIKSQLLIEVFPCNFLFLLSRFICCLWFWTVWPQCTLNWTSLYLFDVCRVSRIYKSVSSPIFSHQFAKYFFYSFIALLSSWYSHCIYIGTSDII